jgi:hypothetical protein
MLRRRVEWWRVSRQSHREEWAGANTTRLPHSWVIHENFARASSALDHGIVVYGNKIIVMILDFLVIRLVRFLGINLM